MKGILPNPDSDKYAHPNYIIMEFEEIQKMYREGYDCAQCVIHAFRDRLEADEATIMRATTCMSMGLLQGSVCGAILAAFTVIGLRYGSDKPDLGSKGLALIKREQFMAEFRKKYNGITCPELTGYDVRINEENTAAFAAGIYDNFCPRLCMDVMEILEKIL